MSNFGIYFDNYVFATGILGSFIEQSLTCSLTCMLNPCLDLHLSSDTT